MNSYQLHSSHRQAGFSLIEILVGLVIGLLVTLVIMQVFSVFEGQKRTTTGAADAQTNGSIGLYFITNELKMAGYGLTPATDNPLKCTTLTFDATGITDITPVTIIDGGAGAGASDSLTIRYATSETGGVPSSITGVGVTGANDITVENNLDCHVGDVALMINGATCNMSNVNGPTDLAIPPVPSSPPNTTTVTLNSIAGAGAAVVGARLACLGSWVTTVFRVNPNYDPTVAANAQAAQAYLERSGTPSVSDIVNIQAQYGVSASAGSNQITQWVNASGATWAAPTVTDRNRIKAIHIAVVARNGLREKDIVTNACTTAKGTVNKGPCAWDDTNVDAAPKIDLSNDPNWQYYRYRVFETIIPLRNMIWASSTL
jgi:type IV pilus assembly protein PilW